MGALGRGMFYRPERKRVRELLSRDASPRLFVEKMERRLFDVSMNGISFVLRDGNEPPSVGTKVAVRLLLHEDEVYSGNGSIARIDTNYRGHRVAIALKEGFLDLPEVVRRDEEGQLEKALRIGPAHTAALVPIDYKKAVAEAVHFVQYYRQVLGRHEQQNRLLTTADAQRREELTQRAASALRNRWTALREKASAAAIECLQDPSVLGAAKQYTETVLTPLLLDVPMVRRSYHKPLGYPGDYRVMLFYYQNTFEGESVFAKVFHKFFVEHPLSNGVRTRCDFVVEQICDHQSYLREKGLLPENYRVASFGSGPAREVQSYHVDAKHWATGVSWTLIDQEDQALSTAYRDIRKQVPDDSTLVDLNCFNISFAQLLDEPALIPLTEKQHFIFSTGLFDYLRRPMAQELIHALYARLAPGGVIAIGNAINPNNHFWSPEFILDWTLLYRTAEQMRELARDLDRSAKIEVLTEPGNAYYFLIIQKTVGDA